MLKKKYRLTTRTDFSYVFKNSRWYVTPGFVLYAARPPTKQGSMISTHPKFAVVTSRKKIGKAVKRNKVKRKMRAVIGNVMLSNPVTDWQLDSTDAFYYIFVARKGIFDYSYAELCNLMCLAQKKVVDSLIRVRKKSTIVG